MADVSCFIGFGETCLWKLEAGDKPCFLAEVLRTGLKDVAGDLDFLTVLNRLELWIVCSSWTLMWFWIVERSGCCSTSIGSLMTLGAVIGVLALWDGLMLLSPLDLLLTLTVAEETSTSFFSSHCTWTIILSYLKFEDSGEVTPEHIISRSNMPTSNSVFIWAGIGAFYICSGASEVWETRYLFSWGDIRIVSLIVSLKGDSFSLLISLVKSNLFSHDFLL